MPRKKHSKQLRTRDHRLPRVLVAEDALICQLVLRQILQKVGCSVEMVGDGRQAVEAFKSQSFDLILMDVSMPEMDGIEATRRIRDLEKNGPKTLIVLMIGYARELDCGKAAELAFNGYLVKPFEQEQLVEMIAALLADPHANADSDMPLQLDVRKDPNAGDTILTALECVRPHKRQALLQAALDDIESQMAKIDNAFQSANWDRVERVTHRLLSTAGVCGAVPLMSLAKKINRGLRSGGTVPTKENQSELLSELDDVQRLIVGSLHDMSLAGEDQ